MNAVPRANAQMYVSDEPQRLVGVKWNNDTGTRRRYADAIRVVNGVQACDPATINDNASAMANSAGVSLLLDHAVVAAGCSTQAPMLLSAPSRIGKSAAPRRYQTYLDLHAKSSRWRPVLRVVIGFLAGGLFRAAVRP